MKKNQTHDFHGRGCLLKTCLVLKFLVLLIFVSSMQLSAEVYSQKAKVTVHLQNATFEDVARMLESATEYTFLYRDHQVVDIKNLNLQYTDVDLKVVLDDCLKGTGLKYSLVDNTIVIQQAQTVTADTLSRVLVKGVVKDEKGEAMPGVTVLIKGTTVGTSTNNKGEYQIMVSPEDVLVFSFIGTTTVEEPLKGRKKIDVTLKESSYEVKEVVVMGLFNRPEDSFTGAVKSFKGDDILKVNPTNVLQALSILDPSVVTIENLSQGSNPNYIPQFEIRGSTSLAGMEYWHL